MNNLQTHLRAESSQQKKEDSYLCSPEDNITRIGVEEDNQTNSTSRFDSDCIYLAMQDGLTESRIILEENNNSSSKNDRINTANELKQFQIHCNHLSQENILLRQRNDELLNELNILKRNMQSQIDLIQQEVEMRVLEQKQIYQRSLEAKNYQYLSQIQNHLAIEKELENQIKQLKSELAIIKNQQETTLIKKGKEKKNSYKYDNNNLLHEANLEDTDNINSFSHYLAGVRSKQHTALKENTRIINENQYGNNQNDRSFKDSLGKLALLAQLGSESIDLGQSNVNQLQDYTITFKEQKKSQENLRYLQQNYNNSNRDETNQDDAKDKGRINLNKGSQNMSNKILLKTSQAIAAGESSKNQMNNQNFKLTRLSQQISKDNLNQNNVLSYPLSIDFKIPVNQIADSNNTCIQHQEEGQEEICKKFNSMPQLFLNNIHDLEEYNPMLALSATYHNEESDQFIFQKQLNLQKEQNRNQDSKFYINQAGRQHKNDSSLSRIKSYHDSLIFMQKACSVGPSRKNSCQIDDQQNYLNFNSSKARKDCVSLQHKNNNSKNNHNLLRFRSNSLAIPSRSTPCQSLRETKQSLPNYAYMKQTLSSKQKQTGYKN